MCMDTLDLYRSSLKNSPIAASSQRIYIAKVSAYLDWLKQSDVDGDPLSDPAARDWAVRDYRSKLKTDKRAASTINTTLAAIDDLYRVLGLGRAKVKRESMPQLAPKALEPGDQKKFLRALEKAKTRDRLIGELGFYAGLRVSEIVGLDRSDVSLSARLGSITVWHGKGDKARTLPLHPAIKMTLHLWLKERQSDAPALIVNRLGDRLSTRAVTTIIGQIGEQAGLEVTPHQLRHCYATNMVRNGTDLVLVADLLGHANLETTRRYSLPTNQNKLDAMIESLPVDL